MNNEVTIETENCTNHSRFIVALRVSGDSFERDLVEGAFESFLNSFGCTVCASESVGVKISEYLDIFVKRFLPILRTQFPKIGEPSFSILPPDRLTYG